MIFMQFEDGTFEPVCVGDINVIADETLSNGEIAIDRLNVNQEFVGSFVLPTQMRKRLMRGLYGWSARGPIRYGSMHRLWEMKARRNNNG